MKNCHREIDRGIQVFRYCIKVVKVAKQEAVAKCGYASAGQLRDLPKPFLPCWEDGVQLDMKQPTQLRELTVQRLGCRNQQAFAV